MNDDFADSDQNEFEGKVWRIYLTTLSMKLCRLFYLCSASTIYCALREVVIIVFRGGFMTPRPKQSRAPDVLLDGDSAFAASAVSDLRSHIL